MVRYLSRRPLSGRARKGEMNCFWVIKNVWILCLKIYSIEPKTIIYFLHIICIIIYYPVKFKDFKLCIHLTISSDQ